MNIISLTDTVTGSGKCMIEPSINWEMVIFTVLENKFFMFAILTCFSRKLN